jgi:YVTN family beta-propeller protein
MPNSASAFACVVFATVAYGASAQLKPEDRVYTADQNSNTVSVINPATNELLGQIRLGNARPDILSPLYKGEINVHGLGFSPDHRTLIAVSNGSNSVTFIDTATNKVKGVTYIGRSPHEGFFTSDGKEVWVVVRGENYISVIDPATFNEVRRIETQPGPGMVAFHPNNKLAFVVSSFTPVAEVVDVKTHKVIKRLPVVSPFDHRLWRRSKPLFNKEGGDVSKLRYRRVSRIHQRFRTQVFTSGAMHQSSIPIAAAP